jgi:hypothetical protein
VQSFPSADTLYSSAFSPDAQQTLKAVPKAAVGRIISSFKDAGKNENGFQFITRTGIYGTDYLNRAFVTAIGLGANRPQDAVYPTSEGDADRKRYSGANKYIMHFDSGSDASGERILVANDV